jgi:hypothetical protein
VRRDILVEGGAIRAIARADVAPSPLPVGDRRRRTSSRDVMDDRQLTIVPQSAIRWRRMLTSVHVRK